MVPLLLECRRELIDLAAVVPQPRRNQSGGKKPHDRFVEQRARIVGNRECSAALDQRACKRHFGDVCFRRRVASQTTAEKEYVSRSAEWND